MQVGTYSSIWFCNIPIPPKGLAPSSPYLRKLDDASSFGQSLMASILHAASWVAGSPSEQPASSSTVVASSKCFTCCGWLFRLDGRTWLTPMALPPRHPRRQSFPWRLEALTQQYMQDGMEAAAARERARAEMRNTLLRSNRPASKSASLGIIGSPPLSSPFCRCLLSFSLLYHYAPPVHSWPTITAKPPGEAMEKTGGFALAPLTMHSTFRRKSSIVGAVEPECS